MLHCEINRAHPLVGMNTKTKGIEMILRNSVILAICLFVVSFSATAAHADTFTYTFSGINSAPGGDGLSVAFEYSSQGPISGLTQVLASQLVSCTKCLVSPSIPAVEFNPGNNLFNSVLGVVDVNHIENFFVFPLGAFLSPGTYISTGPFNSGTLTVVVTPEPSSIVLFLTGVGGVLAGLRRRTNPSKLRS